MRDVAIDTAKNELYVGYGTSWVVLNLADDTVARGPFAFAANVRGIDVDLTPVACSGPPGRPASR